MLTAIGQVINSNSDMTTKWCLIGQGKAHSRQEVAVRAALFTTTNNNPKGIFKKKRNTLRLVSSITDATVSVQLRDD